MSPSLQRYYHFQSVIYDLTRWSFLFGRRRLVQQLITSPPPHRILEIACGTGTNLRWLAQS